MPATEVELDDREEALGGVIDGGDVQEHLGVTHEAMQVSACTEKYVQIATVTDFVILSSMLRGSRMKVGRTTRLRSAPGRSCEMMWERTARA